MSNRNILMKIINKVLPLQQTNIETKVILADVKQINQPLLLSGKRALVIGGGTGIGKAIAKYFTECGCSVIVAGRVDRGDFNFFKWDVSIIEELDKRFFDCINQYGKIDIIVNSQGICPDDDFYGRWENITIEDYNHVMDINAKSLYFICQLVIKYYRDNNISGNILNIASTEGLKGCFVPYGLSKAVVVSMTKGFGKIAAPYGIVVNGIAPGATATNMMRIKDNDLSLSYIPSKRMTIPEEIASIAAMLVSDAGKNVCGEIICVDGGESLK